MRGTAFLGVGTILGMGGRLLLAVMALACSSTPPGGGVDDCGPNAECPNGFTCVASTHICQRTGTSDASLPEPPDASIDATPTDVAGPDAAPPPTTITSQPPSIGNHSTVTLEFTSTTLGATFECSINQAAFVTCVSPFRLTLADGTYTVDVRAVHDGVDGTPAEATFTIDTTPPDTTITSAPTGSVTATTATFMFTSSEAMSTFTCKLDTTAAMACVSGQSYATLAIGSHTFSVFATDPAGNADLSPASATWQVAENPPTAFIDTHPDETTAATTATFTFHSDLATATFECALDHATFAACATPLNLVNLAVGPHNLGVRAVTPGGTRGQPASFSWTIDQSTVIATITSGAIDGVGCASTTFTYTASDSSDNFECSLDSAAFATCPPTGITYTGLSGTHLFAVHAIDAAGNAGPDAQRSFTIDTTAPMVAITVPAAASTTGASVTLTFSTEAGAVIGCTLDGGAVAGCASGKVLSGLTDGPHAVAVTATDSCQNAGSASVAWTADSTPPTVQITSPPDNTNEASSGSIIYSVGDAQTVACTFDGASVPCDTTSPYNYTTGPGQHIFTVTGTDAHGNTSAPQTVTFNVDVDPPTVDSVSFSCQEAPCPPNTECVNFLTVATFNLSDASDIAEIDCVVNGSTTGCGSGTGGSYQIPFMPLFSCETVTFEVYGVDEWQNSGANDSAGSSTHSSDVVRNCNCNP